MERRRRHAVGPQRLEGVGMSETLIRWLEDVPWDVEPGWREAEIVTLDDDGREAELRAHAPPV